MDLDFLFDGQPWRGAHHGTAPFILDVIPSKEHPGYWHVHATDVAAQSLTETRRPMAKALVVYAVSDYCAHRAFAWAPSAAKPSPGTNRARRRSPKRPVVYFVRAGEFVKIGTATDAAKRLTELQTGCPYELSLAKTIPGSIKEEQHLHGRFAHLRSRPSGEWFHYRDDLRAFVEAIA